MLVNDILQIPTPCHVIDLDQIKNNITRLSVLRDKANVKILFAIKGFSNDKIIPMFQNFFDGISASGLWEARLGHDLLKLPVHTYSSAYKNDEFPQIIKYSDYVIFNSKSQLNSFPINSIKKDTKLGIRINPEYSEVEKYAINPCHKFSRFGIKANDLNDFSFENITGMHFHSMCEQFSDTFSRTIDIVSNKFEQYLNKIQWLNLGGGQLFTDSNYNLDEAIVCINKLHKKYNCDIFIEPCETVVLESGYMVASVVDIVHNGIDTAILDASAICHLPDVVHSPYRCNILGSDLPNKKEFTYRLAGPTCYAGDIFGDYSFETPLDIGSRIIFTDTASYSMVKNNFFNGIKPPYYAIYQNNAPIKIVKEYDYHTFLSII